jgi:ATP/maltotriose-dependent transcriptional regulator MalT
MRPAGNSEPAARLARSGAGGVVARRGLWELLSGSARVTVVSAPPGSGKTVLLRSWIGQAGLAERAAWVPVGRDERDPQRLWLAVLGALRETVPGSQLVRELTAAPDLDGWAMVERLLKDLAPLDEPLWLILDDVHELGSDQARRQLELLLMRAPEELRFVLVTRHDVRLGLHRLRLEGELTEIRTGDLRFSLAEARELLAAAGVELTGPALALLVDRTEGWAAGLRLAALSLAGHPDPERFAGEFSGSERTAADRRGQALVLLGMVRLLLAGQRGDLLAVAGEARRLQILAEAPEAAPYDLAPAARAGLSDELPALALIILGDTEIWGARLDQAEPHLEQAAAVARRIGRPYLEFIALAHQSAGEVTRSLPRAAELSRRAIDLAERHGWTDETAAGIAYMALGSVLAWQGRLDEAEALLQRAERTVRAEADPAVALAVHHIRAQLELARGREANALAAFRAAERLAGHLAAPNALATPMRALLALARLGETERAEQVVDGLGDRGRRLIRSAAARSGCCATCPPTCRRRRLPVSCPSRRAPSRPTCGTYTPSSASTAGPRRSSPPAPWACSHPPRARADRPGSRSVQRRHAEGGEQRQAGHQPGDLITD